MWIYLDRLYSEDSNLSQAYDVIQEPFISKQKNQASGKFYADFNKLSEVKEIFLIRDDVKEMQEKWNNWWSLFS